MDMMDTDFIRSVARQQRQLGIGLVEIASGAGRVRITFGTAPAAAASGPAQTAACTGSMSVRAESLGILQAGPAPVQAGDRVAAGQVLACIMLGGRSTEVRAPCAGLLTRVLAAPGVRADYGMPLFELVPGEGRT